MKTRSFSQLIRDVFKIYQQIEQQSRVIKKETGLHCLANCGQCCWSKEIEATVIEMLPLVNHIFRTGKLEEIRTRLDQVTDQGLCIAFNPQIENLGSGFCEFYRYRPLICRTFGFCGVMDKNRILKPQVCKLIKNSQQDEIERFRMVCLSGGVIPLRDLFSRIANLEPGRGYRLLPINLALKECIDMFYWRKPDYFNLAS